ncbi:MAG: tetratricopeptide repeat protein [Deltaproteobacteria bacterium]|nr:tetratricopeptide repeat protein [Deltaproteobacteria bacterium]
MLLRFILLVAILLISFLGYVAYLNHDTSVTLFLVKGRPLPASLPAVIMASFASGAFVVFMVGLVRDMVEGWKGLRKGKRVKKEESLQAEIATGLNLLAKGDPQGSRIHLSNALERDPENIELYARLSDTYAAEEMLEKAVGTLEKAGVMDPENEEILFKKARLYKQMGNPAMAVGALERILAADPSNLTAWRNLREIFLDGKDWKRLMEVQKRIVSHTKNGVDLPRERRLQTGLKYEYALSLTQGEDGKGLERAARLCKEIIKACRGFQPAYLLLGEIYQKQGRWVDAGRVLGRGFRITGGAVFLLHLEDLYLKRNDSKTLLKIYRRILENNPGRAIISLLYSRLCLKLNMLDEAMDELVEMGKRQESDPSFQGLMAEVYAQKGQAEAAVQEYRRVLELTGCLVPGFVCESCGRESRQWMGRCPSCNQWGTYRLHGEEDVARPGEA